MFLEPFKPGEGQRHYEAAVRDAKEWNARFQAERVFKEIEEAKTRHPSMRGN